jgi:hypothetical protein
MIDVVGGQAVPSAPDPHMRYLPGHHSYGGYRVVAPRDRPLRVVRSGGRVRLEDPASGLAGDGASYLDAIQAFQRAVREHRGA